MPTYTFLGQTPDDGTYEVGEGPFPDLPAGTYEGNFYGNDPTLGRIQAGDQRYSVLSDQKADVASSGNTFQVGTGPQPGLPSGVFRPDDVQAFLRDQARLARAEAAATQPLPPQINFAAPTAAPVQTTLPSPVTPVAVPSFVPGGSAPSTVFSGGTPNIGVDNLLAIGAAQAAGPTGAPGPTGFPGIPGVVSPLQSLLPPTSTVPATGTNALAAPNISSGIPASVFSQLFPSVPDISQTPPAMVAHGGPILASEYLNAGGPVQYFSNGGGSHEEDEAAVAPGTVNPNPDPNSNSESGFSLGILDTIKGYVTPETAATTAVGMVANAVSPVVGGMFTIGQVANAFSNQQQGLAHQNQGSVIGEVVNMVTDFVGLEPGTVTLDEDQSVGVGVDPTTGGSFSAEDTGTPTGMPTTQGDINAALPGMTHYSLMSGHDPTAEP